MADGDALQHAQSGQTRLAPGRKVVVATIWAAASDSWVKQSARPTLGRMRLSGLGWFVRLAELGQHRSPGRAQRLSTATLVNPGLSIRYVRCPV